MYGSRTVAQRHDRLRHLLVTAEVAIALVLLTGAGLLVRTAIYLQSVNTGFDSTGVLTARVSLPLAGYESPERVEQTFRDVVDRLSASAGIQTAAVSSNVPMVEGANGNSLVPEGKTFDPNDFVLGRLGIVTGGYFQALGIPLVAGRLFTSGDRRDTERVMILNQTAARRLFPAGNALGKRVSCCEPGPDGLPSLKLVVGVVGDVRSDGPEMPARADFYLPMAQAPHDAWSWLERTMTVVVRRTDADGDPAALAGVIRRATAAVEPGAAVYSMATLPERQRTTLARDRFNTVLMMLLGLIGLVLSAVGIYGLISCFVAQRRHELAIRAALGAGTRSLVVMVLNEGLQPVWLGIVVGVLASALVSRALTAYVYGVTTRDPLTFAAGVLLLVTAAILANVLPARAAARVHPAALLTN